MLLYSLRDTDLQLQGGEEKEYVLKIRDLAQEDKPREKLVRYGPGVLSVTELMAIVLGVGTRKEEVMAMSRRLVKEYGEKAIINQKDPKKIAQALDIPLVKACQIVACFELGRRFFKTTNGRPISIRTPAQVWEYVQDMALLPKEHLRGLYLDSHYQLIHDEVISVGSVTANIVHPREVFKPAIENSASAIILVHNHPSGVVTASKEDDAVTAQLVQAGKILGIHLLDHIIVTKKKYESIKVDYEN